MRHRCPKHVGASNGTHRSRAAWRCRDHRALATQTRINTDPPPNVDASDAVKARWWSRPALFRPTEDIWSHGGECFKHDWTVVALERWYGEELFAFGVAGADQHSEGSSDEALLMELRQFFAQCRQQQAALRNTADSDGSHEDGGGGSIGGADGADAGGVGGTRDGNVEVNPMYLFDPTFDMNCPELLGKYTVRMQVACQP